MLYMVTFTINIPQMLAYIPYMDPMGDGEKIRVFYGHIQIWWRHMADVARFGYIATSERLGGVRARCQRI